MIERTVVNGRPATAAYFDDKFVPTSRADAELIKLVFDDGQVMFLRRAEGQPAPEGATVN